MANVKTMSTAALRKMSDQIRREVMRREDADNLKAAQGVIGKTFRYRNCYSCPQSEADYWWLYARVDGVDEHGRALGLQFSTDKDGVVSVERFSRSAGLFIQGGYQEIASTDFEIAWAAMQVSITKLFLGQ